MYKQIRESLINCQRQLATLGHQEIDNFQAEQQAIHPTEQNAHFQHTSKNDSLRQIIQRNQQSPESLLNFANQNIRLYNESGAIDSVQVRQAKFQEGNPMHLNNYSPQVIVQKPKKKVGRPRKHRKNNQASPVSIYNVSKSSDNKPDGPRLAIKSAILKQVQTPKYIKPNFKDQENQIEAFNNFQFLQRRAVRRGQQIDLGVISLAELVDLAHTYTFISNQLYFEFLNNFKQQSIVSFINAYADQSLQQWDFAQNKITIYDHRRLSELLIMILPQHFKTGSPMSLNPEVHPFLAKLYSLSAQDYSKIMEKIDSISRINWWKPLCIKYRGISDTTYQIRQHSAKSKTAGNLNQIAIKISKKKTQSPSKQVASRSRSNSVRKQTGIRSMKRSYQQMIGSQDSISEDFSPRKIKKVKAKNDSIEPVKRGRGRPPKNEQKKIYVPESPVKRGRGRPRKQE